MLDKIGQGGMGVVYRVRHVELGTILALKVLPAELAQDPELTARFRREARVMARLDHRNIVRVFDLVEEEGELYLVMEYVRGRNLGAHLVEHVRTHDRLLDINEVLRIGSEVCAALAYAHEQEPAIVHRDIKPENILVEEGSGRIVVTDFGIAKLLGESHTRLTRTEGFVGTILYSSPEQMRHDADIDGRADIYALGMILYELYTGRHLYAGMTEEQVVGAVLYGADQDAAVPESDPEFADIVRHAIARDRRHRYASARALLADLQACLRARTMAAEPAAPGAAAAAEGSEGRRTAGVWTSFGRPPVLASVDAEEAFGEGEEGVRRLDFQVPHLGGWARYVAARWWVLLMVAPALAVAVICTADGLAWIGRPFPGFFIMENQVVPTAAAYHWSGRNAGLPNHATIVRIDGAPVATGNDLYRHAEGVPVGTAVTYTVVKDRRQFDLAIPTMRFTTIDYAITFGLLGVNGIVIMLTGLVVAWLSPRHPAARVFLVMSLMMGLYPVTGSDLWRAHRFTVLQLVLQCVTPATFIHLATVFPIERSLSRGAFWGLVVAPYVVGIAMAAWLVRGFFATPVDLTPLYAGYAYSAVGLIILVAGCLLAYVQGRRQVVRGRVQVVGVGVVVAFLLPIAGFFNNMLGGGDFPLNLIALTPIFFFLAVAYAIVKYKLFDTQLFIRRSVVLGCLLTAFTALYGAAVTLLNTTLARAGVDPHAPEFMGGFMALSLASALPLRDRLSAAIERRLFPHKYRSHQTIDRLCRSIARVEDIATILNESTHGLAAAMSLTAGAVLLRDPDGKRLRVATAFGDAPTALVLEGDDPLVRLLAGTRREVFADELREDPDLSALRDACLAVFDALHAEIVIPLISDRALVGMLALGRHPGSDLITSEDLRMLRSLAAGLVLAAVRHADAQRAERMALQRRILEYYLPPAAMRALLGREPVQATIERVRMASLTIRMVELDELAMHADPERVSEEMRAFYALCGRAVRAEAGVLEHYAADSVRAIFTADGATAHEALRAARVAIAVRDAFTRSRANVDAGVARGNVAAGVASGFGYVARIDVGSRTTLHGLGATSAKADHLSDHAEGGQVLADRTAATSVGPTLTAVGVGSMPMRGWPRPIEAFALAERGDA